MKSVISKTQIESKKDRKDPPWIFW